MRRNRVQIVSFFLSALIALSACETVPGVQPAPKPKTTVSVDDDIYVPSNADVLEKTSGVIEAYFGAPSLRRQETGAEVWQYANEECVLLVFFYTQDDGTLQAQHLETRGRTPEAPSTDQDACLKSVVLAKAPGTLP